MLDVEGVTHWFDGEAVDPASTEYRDERGVVDLLQAHDEYVMGYAAPRAYLFPPGRSPGAAPEFPMHAVVSDGVLAGRWAPVVEGRAATVKLSPWRTFSRTEERSLAASVADLERFLGAPVTLERLAG